MTSNIFWHDYSISREERHARHQHLGATVWFTGLSGAGKSTIANAVCRKLFDQNFEVFVLDADNVRHGLNSDLGFSSDDRTENVRRLSEVANLMATLGSIVLVTAVSPFRHDREKARERHRETGVPFIEVFVAASLEECIRRDTKGLYERVQRGEYSGLSGVDAPYEEPLRPEITVNTDETPIDDCSKFVCERILEQVVIPGSSK